MADNALQSCAVGHIEVADISDNRFHSQIIPRNVEQCENSAGSAVSIGNLSFQSPFTRSGRGIPLVFRGLDPPDRVSIEFLPGSVQGPCLR
jgi:hypothetical protein